MSTELHNAVPQIPNAQINVNVQVSASLNITAYTAKRKANVLVLNRIGTGLISAEPQLVVTDKHILWRVPIDVSTGKQGRLGKVGHVDIDAQTGEILADEATLQEIGDNAERLVTRTAS